MTRSALPFVLALFCVFSWGRSAQARGVETHVSNRGEFSFQVEVDGAPAPIYSGGGLSWIEGTHGRSYAIRVFNHTPQRMEAVVTVDGRDVISGRSGDYRKQRGYVIEPHGSALIDGFRQSYQNVAAFYFTFPGDAYATRMGDSANLGVIGVAVFRERYQAPSTPPIAYEPRRKTVDSGNAPKAKKSSGPASGRSMSSYESESAAPQSQGLGTGYGQSTYSPVTTTQFVRRSPRRPDALLSIRYDDRQGLIESGVLPAPYHRPLHPVPRPFPSVQPQFAPPPPPLRPSPPPPWH